MTEPTSEELVERVRQAFGGRKDDGVTASAALTALQERLKATEEERDHYRFHFDQQEQRAEVAEQRLRELEEALQKITKRTVSDELVHDRIPPVDPEYPGHEDMRRPRHLVEFARGLKEGYEDCAAIARAALSEERP